MSEPARAGALAEPTFTEHRRLLLAVAYRVLGRVSDAEDVVQDAWLRWSAVDTDEVADPRAYLVRVTTRLAIDRLRRAQARRESYVGPWLPEPLLSSNDVITDVGEEVAETAALEESVSMAMLVVLETLSPLERAVFVLREVFAFSYAEVADIVGRSEPAVRQLCRRARGHVAEGRPRFDVDRATRRRVSEQFLAACGTGDVTALLGMLAPDVTMVGDGGGQAKAPLRTITGAEKVARFLLGIVAKPEFAQMQIRVADVNGGPGILATAGETPTAAMILDVEGGVIHTVRLFANPAKLSGLRRSDQG